MHSSLLLSLSLVAVLTHSRPARAESTAEPPAPDLSQANSQGVSPSSAAAASSSTTPSLLAPEHPGEDLVRARHHEEDAHLGRVLAWGLGSVAVGSLLVALNAPVVSEGPKPLFDPRWVLGFGVQSIAWGAVDVVIALLGHQAQRPMPPTLKQALVEETTLGDVLWLNLGLDAGYVMAGATAVGAAAWGINDGVDWASHGVGVAVQGAALLALDAVAVHSSRTREQGLWDVLAATGTPPSPSPSASASASRQGPEEPVLKVPSAAQP
jgi:hypothetical protein